MVVRPAMSETHTVKIGGQVLFLAIVAAAAVFILGVLIVLSGTHFPWW
jgi:hypothetical protein